MKTNKKRFKKRKKKGKKKNQKDKTILDELREIEKL